MTSFAPVLYDHTTNRRSINALTFSTCMATKCSLCMSSEPPYVLSIEQHNFCQKYFYSYMILFFFVMLISVGNWKAAILAYTRSWEILHSRDLSGKQWYKHFLDKYISKFFASVTARCWWIVNRLISCCVSVDDDSITWPVINSYFTVC